MRFVIASAAALALGTIAAAASAAPQEPRTIGQETSIPFADRHDLRDWEAGASPDILYVKDYRDDWYRVELSGRCADDLGNSRIAYTTSPGGAFDRFSRVYSIGFPERTCSVLSVKTSAPPPDRQPDKQ